VEDDEDEENDEKLCRLKLEGEIGPGEVGLEKEADGETIGLGLPLPGRALEAKARLENCLLDDEAKLGEGDGGN
jgi:hypothetical protein